MTTPIRIKRPQLYTHEEGGERHATWLELFFDLVFVVAVSQLAYVLHEDLSMGGLTAFAALFVPVWWQWVDFSYYADQFDTGDLPFRVTMLAAMFGIIVFALSIPDALGDGGAFFAGMYAVLRLIIIGLYVRAWRHVAESRPLTGRYVASFTLALLLWVVSIVVPEPGRYVLWVIASLIEIATGPFTHLTARHVPAHVSHMDERFGLFVIIVLGEAVISVAKGVADTSWGWTAVLTAVAGFVVAVGMWWLYFERAEAMVINQALRGDWLALLRSYIYGYSHFFVFAGITATGIGLEVAILASEEMAILASEEAILVEASGFSLPARLALCGGVASFLLGAGLVHWGTTRSLHYRIVTMRVLAAAFCVVLAVFGSFLTPLVLTLCMLLLLFGLIILETRHGYRLQAASPA